jgi:hypothetical protein
MAKNKNRMADDDILAVISQELDQSMSFNASSGLGTTTIVDLETPLDYYLGKPDGSEVVGRSKFTSTDIADAIEWLMPAIMETLIGDNVVTFDAVAPGDEDQAELETAYVFDMLMKRNDGFVIMHQFVKDALLQNNGVIKAYYKTYTEQKVERYTGLDQTQAALLAAQKTITILQKETFFDEEGIPYYNVKIVREKTCSKIHVESVPLENFRINADHNSIMLHSARFTSHEITKTLSDLRKDGVEEDVIEKLKPMNWNNSSYRHEAQGESIQPAHDTSDDSMMQVRINESFIEIDIDGDGVAEYYKITTAGEDTPSLLISIEPMYDGSPWVACTGILMSHKFRGLSIYDRLIQLQDQKTALWRNIFDNIYLQNNQEKEVVESMVNMDDLLVSRPGGIKRVKKAGSINPIMTNPLPNNIMDMARYLDEVKAGRVGVSADGASAPQNIGDRVGSEGVDQLMTAKQALSGLIVRVIAETGIKPLCIKLRDLANTHIDTIEDFKFRGLWRQVNPAEWQPRMSTTVNVGTGSGDKGQKLMAVQQIQLLQEKIAASPLAYLVSAEKVYTSINDFCKYSGLLGAERYVLDPKSPEGLQAAEQYEKQQEQQRGIQQQIQAVQLESERKIADSALKTAEAEIANVNLKGQVEALKNERAVEKQQSELAMAQLQAQLEQFKQLAQGVVKDKEFEFKYSELDQKTFVALATLNNAKDIALLSSSKQETEANAND